MATTAARKRYLQTERGKATSRAYYTRWRKENRAAYLMSMRRSDLKRHYGLTIAEWDELFLRQGRRCGACGSLESGRKNGQWATDHCHTTKKVRGILCNGCNVAIGHARDDPDRLRMLAVYLETGGVKHGRDQT